MTFEILLLRQRGRRGAFALSWVREPGMSYIYTVCVCVGGGGFSVNAEADGGLAFSWLSPNLPPPTEPGRLPHGAGHGLMC